MQFRFLEEHWCNVPETSDLNYLPKCGKNAGVITVFYENYSLFDNAMKCIYAVKLVMWYDLLPSLVSPDLLYFLLSLLYFTLTFSSLQTSPTSTILYCSSVPCLFEYPCSPLLSLPAVMSKGQRVSCLLLCCQCSCLLPSCLLALAFSCCPYKCEAQQWNSWWRKDDLRVSLTFSISKKKNSSLRWLRSHGCHTCLCC